ncbi:MAG TPA: hypothetical protein VFA08_07315 [Actinomycetota bacterium]|nr:hypothetical protein [Actinomycetota bacterium]
MTALTEVFEMVRNQIELDQDGWWEEHVKRRGGASRNRKVGAIALSAGLFVAAAWLVLGSSELTDHSKVVQEPASIGMTLPPSRGLYFLDLATGQVTGEPSFAALGARHPVVSPDGAKVAFVGIDEDLEDAIFVADVDGRHPRPLGGTTTTGTLIAPQWSPDGAQIAYQAKGKGQFVGDLFIVDVTTGRARRLTHLDPVSSPLWWMGPRFSPDGEAVLFTFPHGEPGRQTWNVWSVPVSGGKPTLVRSDATDGSLSPDARTIAYFPVNGTNVPAGDLWLADADGADARPLVRGELVAARWSPDGTRIAYADEGRMGTYIVDVGTGEARRVLDDPSSPEWLDDRTLIFVVE